MELDGTRTVIITLPSGRELFYYDVKITEKGISVLKIFGKTKLISSFYGGQIAQNIVQALARDICAQAFINVNYHEYGDKIEPVLTVHDEIVFEIDETIEKENGLSYVDKIMTECPFLPGLPLSVESEIQMFYSK